MVVELDGEQHQVNLKLTSDELSIQREELAYTTSCTDHVDAAVLAKVRVGLLYLVYRPCRRCSAG